MNKYKVTRGKESREIVANNDREALRRFGTTQGDGTRADVLEANVAEPQKHRYRVSWGDETREVEAVHEDDAWSQFIGGNENHQAYKTPKAFPRVIECLDKECNEDADSQSDKESDGGTSPVAEMSAEEAKDAISRMHSAEKLQSIAKSDKRATVRKAAQDKLDSTENK